MTNNIQLLPLPEGEASSFGDYQVHDNEAMIKYARANVANAIAPLQAEIERDEALLRQALEALEFEADGWEYPPPKTAAAITALREALAEPEPRNQCRETCERAKLCAICARGIVEAEQQEPVAWMVYTLDGTSVCVTDNPADFTDEQRALPLYTQPFPTDEALLRQALDALAYWLEHGETPGSHDIIQRTHDVLRKRLKLVAQGE